MMSLQIIDDGPGISPSERGKILMPFGRGDAAQAQKADGVGLGLTIVSELLKLQGGRLEIGDGKERGSIFSAIFPAGTPVRREVSNATS